MTVAAYLESGSVSSYVIPCRDRLVAHSHSHSLQHRRGSVPHMRERAVIASKEAHPANVSPMGIAPLLHEAVLEKDDKTLRQACIVPTCQADAPAL